VAIDIRPRSSAVAFDELNLAEIACEKLYPGQRDRGPGIGAVLRGEVLRVASAMPDVVFGWGRADHGDGLRRPTSSAPAAGDRDQSQKERVARWTLV
jgi:hypothetical protein